MAAFERIARGALGERGVDELEDAVALERAEPLRLLPLAEHHVPRDAPAPGLEVAGGVELAGLLEDDDGDFLEDVLGQIRVAREGADVRDQPEPVALEPGSYFPPSTIASLDPAGTKPDTISGKISVASGLPGY
jgi:hypothetical protein